MATLNNRLKALEQHTEPQSELPTIVSDKCKNERITQLQRNGRKVYRESDEALIEEFI